ncbi:glycosyltransferase family 2 protein [Mangrovivirga sp. M17]|uniref:Glycosyltransferase family 2 protein n=1 Tax=Mangrovivirga halotolerans TaxID=2993936 RepID=A0ABT3RN84_9BACT|nr:glycosyltransferase family 2 protein [Mangrovivirga halotolerans]MCX2743056.1 glycosyltransferase family 2 protein [Mangrovivirga halotolerans]
MDDLISILMPVKNAEKFLTESLESILNQSEKNWELIAVDDHSADTSRSIIEKYKKRDQRIRILSNQGKGIISALRTGYKHSKGSLIHRMDADDIMSMNKLYELKARLTNLGKGHIVTSMVEYFSSDGVSEGYKEYERWLNQLCENDKQWEHIYEECVIASPNWMVYKYDLDKAGAFDFDRYPEDYDLIFRFYKNNLSVKSIAKTLHYWREHPDRTSRNSDLYQQKAFFELKTYHWLKLEYSNEHVIIFGGGIKGKTMSQILQLNNIDHDWLKEKPRQIDNDFIKKLTQENSKIIITIGDLNEKKKIHQLMTLLKLKRNKDYYYFR